MEDNVKEAGKQIPAYLHMSRWISRNRCRFDWQTDSVKSAHSPVRHRIRLRVWVPLLSSSGAARSFSQRGILSFEINEAIVSAGGPPGGRDPPTLRRKAALFHPDVVRRARRIPSPRSGLLSLVSVSGLTSGSPSPRAACVRTGVLRFLISAHLN